MEEQFYLVWPFLFLLVSTVARRRRFMTTLTTALLTIIVLSFLWSIIQTRQNGVWAFFSPFTRAWELAAGALLAVGVPVMTRLPVRLGILLSWIGVVAVMASAFVLTSRTPFPGYAVALPVLGSALAIAGGTIAPGMGAETVLRLAPLQWVGKLSYSLYLWHWPLITIAAERAGVQQPVFKNMLWVLLAAVLALAVYVTIENPIRHAGVLTRKPWLSLALGLCLALLSYRVCAWEIQSHHTHRHRVSDQVSPTLSGWSGPA